MMVRQSEGVFIRGDYNVGGACLRGGDGAGVRLAGSGAGNPARVSPA